MATNNNNNKKQALGKGIRALLNNIDEELSNKDARDTKPNSVPSTGIMRIPVDQIQINPKQPRHDFDEQALNELAESIKLHDIIQPITVVKLANGKFQLIS